MTTSHEAPWRRLAVLPLVVLIAAVSVLNAAGWLIDASSLDQGEDSWGYAFGAFFLSLYAVPLVVVAACSALVGGLSSHPGAARGCAWVGSVVCGVAAAVLAPMTLAWVSGVAAAVVFALVALVTALALVVPAGLCVRLSLRQRASAAAS